ncbi:Rieske 2Fe-2S domain-containing protein [Nereida sp. MMG025]|uniref:Rieske 2Fe-2S domain-containing protein n=1 Tax=Nereida sp. MMG025 TaxID=2909981 RepID=UPI001F41E81B|nr:Rieske 2Fe-2S domain-containing protein [Nereida sp. MMG025]MCF6443735.1 Rieske 2Fe-2S domain-containing protein [Nereida sp. MMG025]
MTMPPRPHWQAVALSKDLRRKPLRLLFNGAPVVLFRAGSEIKAIEDRCPHRFANLSDGRVVEGQIECPYHGWRFDGQGQCRAIPGHQGPLPRVRIRRFHVAQKDGAIFISGDGQDHPPFTFAQSGQDVVVHRARSTTRSTVLDTAENILDATHTHFTHKGLLRGLSHKRHLVDVKVTGGADWVQADYTGEPAQEGLVSKLLDGLRVRTVGRFRAGGIVELEYWGPRGLVLATTFHLRQATTDTVEGIAWLVGPRQKGWGHIKGLAFKPLFNIALWQDKRILAATFDNASLQPRQSPVIGPLDFLRRDIARILEGKTPNAAQKPQAFQIML